MDTFGQTLNRMDGHPTGRLLGGTVSVPAVTSDLLDPSRFAVRWSETRGFRQAYVREGEGGYPLLLVHGWPETMRIFWRVISGLADAGFDVIVPDLRGFGASEVGPDGFHDVAAHAADLAALLRDLGVARAVIAGGDLGGPVVSELALRNPELVERLVLCNSPLPYDRTTMAGLATRPPAEVTDYFIRQGTDADALAAELDTIDKRRRYIATFYTSRLWAHPGAFDGDAVDFHTAPFGDGVKLRASFGAYESVFDPAKRSEPSVLRTNPTHALLLFGTSDHVIAPDFDRMAALVFPDHVGPFLLRDCGHFVPWERADTFIGAVRSFSRDLLDRPAQR
ncbi:MAG: alpha/beta hydrolase [Acidimicrobiales bacterium]